jgi:hypothetical protein
MTLGPPTTAIVPTKAGRAGNDHDGRPLDCNKRLAVGGIGISIGVDCAAMLGHTTGKSGIIIVGGGGGKVSMVTVTMPPVPPWLPERKESCSCCRQPP